MYARILRLISTMAQYSAETHRCSAYHDDLRWRMIYQRESLGYTYQQIASNLNVDTTTVWRTVQLFHDTGVVSKRKYNKDNLPRKVNESVSLMILHVVLDHPGIYLREIQKQVEYLTGSSLSPSTICKVLHDQGFSRKKMQLIARQRDVALRAIYAAEMSVYDADMFVFLDETGSDRRNVLRKYGYSWRGKRGVSHKLLVRGEHLNTIACISMEGVLECTTVNFSVDGDVFYNFVHSKLLPLLMPFNGRNPHSVVVLDNASIHHVDGIVDLITGIGALIIFLPPYSPDYNPIEEAFSKVKTLVKTYEEDLEMNHLDMMDIVLAGFAHITKQDCQNWIEHCGIYN